VEVNLGYSEELVLDFRYSSVLNCLGRPEYVPDMAQDEDYQNQNEVLIKFLAPLKLKHALLKLVNERKTSSSQPS
jgi:short-subunit dehydrogenase involved in D-alanine esterification of teichoic acids